MAGIEYGIEIRHFDICANCCCPRSGIEISFQYGIGYDIENRKRGPRATVRTCPFSLAPKIPISIPNPIPYPILQWNSTDQKVVLDAVFNTVLRLNISIDFVSKTRFVLWSMGIVPVPTCAAVEPVEEVVGLALPGGAQGVGRVLPPVQRPLSSSPGQSAAARVRDGDGRAPVARAVQRAEPSPAGSLELLSTLRIISFPFSSTFQIY